MKKFIKWSVIALVAAIFVGTFVFLYQKSRPKEKVYEVSIVQVKDLENRVMRSTSSLRFRVSLPICTRNLDRW